MDTIELNCQFCGSTHSYTLKIDRTPIMRGLFKKASEQESDFMTFTRLFTCPENGKMFQAAITIKEKAGTSIKDIAVAGII